MVRKQHEQQVHAMHAYMHVTHHSTFKLEAFSMTSHHNTVIGCQFAKSTHFESVCCHT